jgi:hypothetical protein
MTWDVREVWPNFDPEAPRAWPQPESADTSAYLDATDNDSGTVTAGGAGFPGEGPANAFDNTDAKYCVETPTMWIEYVFETAPAPAIAAYTITSANDAPERDPRNWVLLGSDNGQDWVTVDERTDEAFMGRHQKRLFEIPSPRSFRTLRLVVSANAGNSGTSQLEEIEYLVPKP